MAKRAARQSFKQPIKAPPAPEAVVEAQQTLSPEQAIMVLKSHVEICRNAFFRLANVRAADLVRHEGKTWDQGANYINAEMQGLDQQLAAATPSPVGNS